MTPVSCMLFDVCKIYFLNYTNMYTYMDNFVVVLIVLFFRSGVGIQKSTGKS